MNEKDRVSEYFKKVLDDYLFDQMSDDFLEKLDVKEIMTGVPIAIKAVDFAECYKKGESLKIIDIARSVAVVLGSDLEFPHRENYIAFLQKLFGEQAEEVLINEGHEKLKEGQPMEAAALFRAAMAVKPKSLYGIYSYALVCRQMYMESDEEEVIGKFKAESIEALEILTDIHPDFAFTYYYLGYAYLNMGLYKKTQLTWHIFMEKIVDDPLAEQCKGEIAEIEAKLNELDAPIEIEEGINAVSSGRYNEGISMLEKYLVGKYDKWWPMHYYIGIAYECTNRMEEAINAFKTVLTINPENIDSMDELVAIYHIKGDKDNEIKYSRKIELVKNNLKELEKQNIDQ